MPTQPAEKTLEKKATTPTQDAGENISTAGFALAIASIFTNFFSFGLMAIAALVLSIVGRVRTKRAGRPSSFALAGIIISSIVIFLTFVSFVLFFVLLVNAGSKHQIDCDSPRYIKHDVCMYDGETPLGPQSREESLRIDPDRL